MQLVGNVKSYLGELISLELTKEHGGRKPVGGERRTGECVCSAVYFEFCMLSLCMFKK